MSKTRLTRTIGGTIAGAAAVGLVLMGGPANAEKIINMTAIDGYPPKAMWVSEFIKFFIPEVDKRLAAKGNYKIKWNKAFAGAIVKPKGVFKGLQAGLGDIGIITTVFHTDKVPLQAIAYTTPFVTTDSLLLTRTIDALANKYPAIKGAFAKYGIHYLVNGVVIDSYQLVLKKPITKLSDLKGIKVAAAGTNQLWMKNLGVIGVGGSLVSYLSKLKTGVVEGAMIWPEVAAAWKFYEIAPYMVDGQFGAVNSKVIAANAKYWKKLPGEVRATITEVSVLYRDHIARTALKRGAAAYKKFTAKGGKIITLTAAQRMAWAKSMPNVAKAWAKRMDKKGLPGTKMLKEYMGIMRQAKQPILRQWDRE